MEASPRDHRAVVGACEAGGEKAHERTGLGTACEFGAKEPIRRNASADGHRAHVCFVRSRESLAHERAYDRAAHAGTQLRESLLRLRSPMGFDVSGNPGF